jgi:hypothetical protein
MMAAALGCVSLGRFAFAFAAVYATIIAELQVHFRYSLNVYMTVKKNRFLK